MVVFLASMSGVEFCQLTKYGPPGVGVNERMGGREGGREGGRAGGRQYKHQFSFFKITKTTVSTLPSFDLLFSVLHSRNGLAAGWSK